MRPSWIRNRWIYANGLKTIGNRIKSKKMKTKTTTTKKKMKNYIAVNLNLNLIRWRILKAKSMQINSILLWQQLGESKFEIETKARWCSRLMAMNRYRSRTSNRIICIVFKVTKKKRRKCCHWSWNAVEMGTSMEFAK